MLRDTRFRKPVPYLPGLRGRELAASRGCDLTAERAQPGLRLTHSNWDATALRFLITNQPIKAPALHRGGGLVAFTTF